jgi:hypothetical protein
MVEPVKAKLSRFLGHFTTNEMLILTVGIASANTSCVKPWASVMLQEDQRVVRTGSELGDKTDQYVAAVSWTHPLEDEEQKLAPRTVIYPMESSEFMDLVKAGQQHTLPPEYEELGASVSQSCDILGSRAEFKLYNYEEALKVDSMVGKWIQLAQTAALGSHQYVLEDRPDLPKYPDPTRTLEGKLDKGCTPKAARRYATPGFQEMSDNHEWEEAKFRDRRRSQRMPALFRSPAGLRRIKK